jgi:hypothetical protein
MCSLARTCASDGGKNPAVAQLRQLMAMPSGPSVSVARLRGDRAWPWLRDGPRFVALVEPTTTAASAAKHE